MSGFKETRIYKNLLNFYSSYITGFSTKVYSQEGEDLILHRFLEGKKNGFYIDVGALHPKRFSNTYFFYKKGWSGINIEPRPGSKVVFDRFRKRDINLELAVSKVPGNLKYFVFDEPALNSFDSDLSELRSNTTKYRIINTIEVKVVTLEQILDDYLPPNQIIDFLTVDVEGFDLSVLQSNNWKKYCPKFVLVEQLEVNLNDIYKSEIYLYLNSMSYNLVAKSYNTSFYIKSIL